MLVLKHDCVRKTLLYLEETLTLDSFISTQDMEINDYSREDIIYTIKMLTDAGYINAKFCGYDDQQIYYVSSLTWRGHLFLDNIRDNVVWRKTKSILSKFASVSLEITSQVAGQVITNLISKSI